MAQTIRLIVRNVVDMACGTWFTLGMEMQHGTGTEWVAHQGICLTPSERAAGSYAKANGTWQQLPAYIHTVEIDLDGLTVVTLDGYQSAGNTAPGDASDSYEADVLVYEDEDHDGRAHTTYRLMTPTAVAAVTYIATEELD